MSKPARLQVDPGTLPDDRPPQTGNVYNVWYLKWSGGDGTKQFTKSKFKVNIEKDAGYTRANKTNVSTICVYFAKGCCYRGRKCEFLHRVPTETDYYPPTQDCFGRDKTLAHRDDMNGPGILNDINDTLYISGLSPGKGSMESVITRHFGEFGSISKIKILPSKNCGFITFKHEVEAQFAKEAMDCQSLDDNEVLQVRWASADPDPAAQASKKRKLEEITMNTVKRMLEQTEREGLEITEPEVEEPDDDSEIEEPPRKQKLISHNVFHQDLSILAQLKKKKQAAKSAQVAKQTHAPTNLNLEGYSSEED